MPFHTVTTWSWLVSGALIMLAIAVQRRRRHVRFPPGPTPLPIVGKLLDFPRTHLGREFAALSKRFGDVVYLSLLGQDIVVLGSLKAAHDLLDKRSVNYSDRPPFVMAQLIGWDWLTPLVNYGARWRQHRRAMHRTMAPKIVPQYEATQLDAAHKFLPTLSRNSQGLASHINHMITAMCIEAIYGMEMRDSERNSDNNLKYHQMMEKMMEVVEAILLPSSFLVEAFPVLRYLPSWFPGGSFKTWASIAKRDIAYSAEYLSDSAKAAGGNSSRQSVVNRILEDREPQERQAIEKLCKEVAVTTCIGAADALITEMGVFFMAMVLYPDAQRKAQEELDAVVGAERLPEFSDRPSLPYINALVKELLRWHPATPLGLPHSVVSDDEYNGHLIPSGATVLVNMWAILRDPGVYPQPDDFKPERFLDSAGNLDVQGRDPADVAFGFGRRVCVGRHFAESTLFIVCASVLAAFDIGPPIGEDGMPIEVKWEATDHLVVSHPKVHKYSLQPRSSNVERLVEMAH